MNWVFLTFSIYLLISFAKLQNITCPKYCRCLSKTVRCVNVRLRRIPADAIPKDTRVLDLRYNYINELAEDALNDFPELENLFLENNIISKIEPNAFSKLRKLKRLYLMSNRIEIINDDTFGGLFQLEILYLQNNAIRRISPGAFKDLQQLRRIYLHQNSLTSISYDVIKPMKELRRIRIASNQITCTCQFLRLFEKVYEDRISIGATCYDNGREFQVYSLTYEDLGCIPPQFEKVPRDRSVVLGQTVGLDCQAVGNPPPSISWIKDGETLEDTIRHKIEDDGSLTLYDFSSQSAGYYQCLIENDIGKDSAGAILSVGTDGAIPSFTIKPQDIESILNSPVVFNCRSRGYPKPDIIWHKNGEILRDNNHIRVSETGDLEFNGVESEDAGYYTCEAKNNLGSVTHTAKLIVQAAPSFFRRPENQRVLHGETASFECRATGYPPPAVAWLKDRSRLPSDGKHVVLPSGTLQIVDAREVNEGSYQCQAINVFGVISAEANLEVVPRVSPRITEYPTDLTVQSGNAILLRCNAQGAPDPVVTWMRNGIQVTPGNRFIINSTRGTIEIRDIGNVDAGRWECIARNSIGFASQAFRLTVIGLQDGTYEGDQFVLQSIEKAREEVDRAIQLTKQKLKKFSPRSPSDLLALFRFPSQDAIEIARSAEIFEIALDLIQKSVESGILDGDMKKKYQFNALISPDHIQLIANLSGCTAHKRLVNCSDVCYHRKYRSFDGSCNNFNHPMWGAALTPFSRVILPTYENGFNTPVGWNNTKLPSARKISLDLISTVNTTSDDEFTHMLMQWGQFLDHDMDFTVTSPSTSRFNDGKSCRDSCENEQPCFPIKIPKDDPRIKRYECMEFTRSSAVCGSGSTSLFFDTITPRQQINQITSFIDASNVYGSSDKDARDLRAFDNDRGLLKQGIHFKNGKFLLPFNRDTPIDCQVNPSESRVPCFLAGDHRANEQLGLLSMHTIWMRQHNRIATELHRLNPHWNGEKIYQETRKVIGAQMQHISYKEWLPHIIGEVGVEKLGEYKGYNPNVDPTIFNGFATAAFRFGHTLIQPILARLDEKFQETKEGNLPLHKAFFSPHRLVEEGGIDPLIRGLFGTAVKDRRITSQLFNKELTERLFEMAHTVALDLAALNIQRGRDHGLPNYNSWRQFCNMPVANNFEEYRNEIKNETLRQILKELYGTVDNIDLMVGGILEDAIPGTRLGPTFLCLITLQFQKVRDGDRFWYENPGVFSPEQVTQIKQTTLARVICDNSDDIRNVQYDVFKRAKGLSEYAKCVDHTDLDLRFWKECCTETKTCTDNGSSNTISNFIRNSRSARQPPTLLRKKRSIENFLNETNSYENLTQDNRNQPLNIQQSSQHTKKRRRQNKTKKCRKKITKLENKIIDLQNMITNMKTELGELRKDVFGEDERIVHSTSETDKNLNSIHKWCIDDMGTVKDNGEKWIDQMNRKCNCMNSVMRCS